MDESVSEFIVATCRMLPKYNTNIFESMNIQAPVSLKVYHNFCGSSAEFFIQPLHSCIGDVDCFKTKLHSLAFTDEKPVLPYDVRHIADTIDCLLMEPYPGYPSFVRLRLFGQMKYNWERKTYQFNQTNFQKIPMTTKMNENDKGWRKTGPASKWSDSELVSFSLDVVESVWCPQWPNEAKHWPFRQRKYGWPTTSIIHEIVQNGCHVVEAKHPACRNDIHQYRLSFSIAEVILLQSWTEVQQIVYHLLRFLAKRELFKKDCPKEDEVLCTYYFKTLMLWSCEEVSPRFWRSSYVIKMCSKLFERLSKWLKEKSCPNYFIPQANLFHDHFNQTIVDETVEKLIYFSDFHNLSWWCAWHYVKLSLLKISVIECNNDAVICIYEHMLQTTEAMKADKPKVIDYYVSQRFCEDVDYAHITVEKGFNCMFFDFSKYLLRIGSPFDNNLDFRPSAEIESYYWFYESMLHILHAAQLLDCKEMHTDSEWFLEVIRHVSIKPKYFRSKNRHVSIRPKYFRSKDHNLPNTGFNIVQFNFIRAQNLMENLIESSDDLELQVVSEIAKGLLKKALKCEDSQTHTIANATLAYMAALHFAASDYQIVMDLCSKVIMNEDREKQETETLNAGCLLYIEDITKIIGFYLIFRKIKDSSLHYTKRQFFLDLRLTPEVFAKYLTISSMERTVRYFGPIDVHQTPTFPLDAILMTIINRKFSQISKKRKSALRVYQRIDPMNKLEAPTESCLPNEDNIIQLLIEYSLGNMTSFYNAICKDYGIDCSTVDCYRAAYLYQCRKNTTVLHLCERIFDEPDIQEDLKELGFANVMVLPPFDSYFDINIRCLLGFRIVVCYLLPSNEDLGERQVSAMSTFQDFVAQNIHSDKELLSRVLLQPYSIKCHYFLGRHFLARYLKVRCLIECNRSLSEVMFEFKKLKACLPFEHIVRSFLEQKLRQLRSN